MAESVFHLIVMWRQLVKQLLDAVLLSWAVYVWHFLLW